jgi:hypothetical protein
MVVVAAWMVLPMTVLPVIPFLAWPMLPVTAFLLENLPVSWNDCLTTVDDLPRKSVLLHSLKVVEFYNRYT